MDDYPDPTELLSGDILWPRHSKVRAIGGIQDWQQVESLRKLLPVMKGKLSTIDHPDSLDDLYLLLLACASSLAEGVVKEPGAVFEDLFGTPPPSLRTELAEATVAGWYVGHVAMIERSVGKLWVIESSYRANGVQIQPYDRWLDARRSIGAHVWHGRVQYEISAKSEAPKAAALKKKLPVSKTDEPPVMYADVTSTMADKMLEEAHRLRMQNRQYAIFDRGFRGKQALKRDDYVYCSEMVWRCAKSIGVDLDARSTLEKGLPFLGPRVLTKPPFMRMIFRPHGQDY